MGLDYLYLHNTTRISKAHHIMYICLLLVPKDPLKYVVIPITYLLTYLLIYIYTYTRSTVMCNDII